MTVLIESKGISFMQLMLLLFLTADDVVVAVSAGDSLLLFSAVDYVVVAVPADDVVVAIPAGDALLLF